MEPEPEDQPATEETPSSDGGAKWFVIAFLLIVPALGVTLLGAILWALWKVWFA